MNFLIFALLVVPTVYSLTILPVFPSSLIPDNAISKDFFINKYGNVVLKTATIDVKKATKPYPQNPHYVENFFSSSTDFDGNLQPDNHQIKFVEPIIGPVFVPLPVETFNNPLIPYKFIKKQRDLNGNLISVTIDVEKVQRFLGSPLYPYFGLNPGTVVEEN